jgi:hypothetical protein
MSEAEGEARPQEARPLEDRASYIERVMRALSLSGRRLARTPAGWSVLVSADRRGRARLLLEDAEVRALAGAGRLKEIDADMYVAGDVAVAHRPLVEPWAFIEASRREKRRQAGVGFTAMVYRAKAGEGPLTMRHVEAGLKLISDVEQRENSRGLTMNWDAGPVDRQRRTGTSGGFHGMAARTAARLRMVKRHTSLEAFSLAWALCIEATPLRTLKERFGIGGRRFEAAVAAALEEIAAAYDRAVAG